MTPQVQVLVGMVGAGKSTYAANAARAGCLIVNDDSLVTAVHGGDYSLYDKSLKPVYKSVGQTILTHAAALGRSVVIDTGSRNRITRSRWVSLAKTLDLPVMALEFGREHPSVHAERRYSSDARGYSLSKWIEVAERHDEVMESVTKAEGFDVIVRVDWERVQQGQYCRLLPETDMMYAGSEWVCHTK